MRFFVIAIFIFCICIYVVKSAGTGGAGGSSGGNKNNNTSNTNKTNNSNNSKSTNNTNNTNNTTPSGSGVLTNISWIYNPNPSALFNLYLARPSDTMVTLSLIALVDCTVSVEYWSLFKIFKISTDSKKMTLYKPNLFELINLTPDTNYTYRIHYFGNGVDNYTQEYSFHTARPKGQSFSFAIEADPHLDDQSNFTVYRNTLRNILNERPDFMLSLGDFLMSDKLALINYEAVENRSILFRQYYDFVCGNVPLFMVLGNHEGEFPNARYNLTSISTEIRSKYFPNPEPNSFFSGNNEHLENYYSFEWGNALLVIIDPFRSTYSKDQWGWSLGKAQYDWFRSTLEHSNATFKFVFAHNLVGGGSEARGGIEFAKFYEWGGYHLNGSYGFDSLRAGWGKPIHQILVDTKVRAFFHGHDHLYVKQTLDGIVYQEVPQPSHINLGSGALVQANEYGYTNGTVMGYGGHLLVNVTEKTATVNYIMHMNVIEDSYVFNA